MRQAMMFSKRGTSSAEVQSLIDASVGGGQLAAVGTWQFCLNGLAGSGTINQNGVILWRFRVTDTVQINVIRHRNGGTLNGNVDSGVYVATSATDWSRLSHAGVTAQAGATAVQALTQLTTATCEPGADYGLAFGTDSATATVYRITRVDSTFVPSPSDILLFAGAWSSGLPATLSGGVTSGNMLMLVGSPA